MDYIYQPNYSKVTENENENTLEEDPILNEPINNIGTMDQSMAQSFEEVNRIAPGGFF